MIRLFENSAAQASKTVSAATLVISFYKSIRMLELVLASVQQQTNQNFEIIICDDGSPENTVNTVKQLLHTLPRPARHLWHEDLGFRKNRILNWALHYCKTEVMIFIDQDCILHSEFVAEHIKAQTPKTVVCGRRINLTSFVSDLLTPAKVADRFLPRNIWWLMLIGILMKDNNGIKGLYFRNPWLRNRSNKKPRGIVGCNFSVHRQDLLAVNGFDTRYEGAGFGEDSDLEHRLDLIGVQMKPACNTAVQYHIYHKLLIRSNSNESLFNHVLAENNPKTSFGLQQQLQN